jgi:tRNA G18 (ribose-2'-O)-methylase SpoU
MEELNRISAEEARSSSRLPFRIVLDDVRSMNNVGAVFRTADAFNAGEIALCGVTPRPPHRDIHKTALGATDSVPWQYFENIEDTLKQFRDEGYEIWAVEQTQHSTSLQDCPFSARDKIVLIFGNEVHGVSDKALAFCKGSLEIPQWGAKHSLNISVSVGVVLWELTRKLND